MKKREYCIYIYDKIHTHVWQVMLEKLDDSTQNELENVEII